MDTDFAAATLNSLHLRAQTRLLAVCASSADWDLLTSLGFSNVTVSNLDMAFEDMVPQGHWSYQDVQALSFDDASFDWVFVSEGLHHCRSPHRGLLEMYRVCRLGIVAIESRDSTLMRLAVAMGLAQRYELAAVISQGFGSGGLDNTSVPNHVYRWTEAEVLKTLRSYDPTGEPQVEFRYGLRMPAALTSSTTTNSTLRGVAQGITQGVARGVARGITTVCKRQANQLAIIARRPTALYPWLAHHQNQVRFNPNYQNPKPHN
ncbi:MAG: methyltransferase domain-containing protein [bacterium]|nr:methyltransferase domain-containing protein [bacterium]MCY4257172.1 methyltransferase domain-containing protein [bacterium]